MTQARRVQARLPKPLHRVLSAVYAQRPSARAFRRGLADRNRVALTVHRLCDGIVQRGPFMGMVFPHASTDAASKCIGSYERELHAEIREIMSSNYHAIVNVGCAEGFYAVGLARGMPDVTIFAFDTNPDAVQNCKALALANGLPASQLAYGGKVTHELLNELCGPGVLVVADIEGAEEILLDPTRAPRLAEADILVELHETAVPGIEDLMRLRFSRTHAIKHIESEPRIDPDPYTELASLHVADQKLAMFERPIVMRWLMLRAKALV